MIALDYLAGAWFASAVAAVCLAFLSVIDRRHLTTAKWLALLALVLGLALNILARLTGVTH